MPLPDVSQGDPHVEAHNAERQAINALQNAGGGGVSVRNFAQSYTYNPGENFVLLGASYDSNTDLSTPPALVSAHASYGATDTAVEVHPDVSRIWVFKTSGIWDVTITETVTLTQRNSNTAFMQSIGFYSADPADALLPFNSTPLYYSKETETIVSFIVKRRVTMAISAGDLVALISPHPTVNAGDTAYVDVLASRMIGP